MSPDEGLEQDAAHSAVPVVASAPEPGRIKPVPIALAGALLFIVLAAPMPGLTEPAHRVAAVAAAVVLLWITEAIPLALTGLLVPALLILLGVAPPAQAFAPFADPIMFLFIGAFMLARALSLHQLDRRFAYWVLAWSWIDERPGRILFAYGAVCCLISMWISNTATCAMMYPIGLAILGALAAGGAPVLHSRYASALMLMCAFSASIGGLATPVGTPTNLIGLGFIARELERPVGFFEWMSFGVPIAVALYLTLFGALYGLAGRNVVQGRGMRNWLHAEQVKLGRLTPARRNTALAFAATIALWVLPGVLALTLGDAHPWTQTFSKRLPESVAALLGVALLVLLPLPHTAREERLSLPQLLQIDWGVLLLYGGGITLGSYIFSSGLAAEFDGLFDAVLPGWLLLLAAIAVAVLISELTSNVSSANIVVPVVIAAGGAQALPMAVAATLACSLGFMLPVSTPTNAIVYSSGQIPLQRMIRYGALLDLLGIVIILAGVLLLVPVR